VWVGAAATMVVSLGMGGVTGRAKPLRDVWESRAGPERLLMSFVGLETMRDVRVVRVLRVLRALALAGLDARTWNFSVSPL
jgi:hypothetical protein